MVYLMLISLVVFTLGFFFSVKLFIKYGRKMREGRDISDRKENSVW